MPSWAGKLESASVAGTENSKSVNADAQNDNENYRAWWKKWIESDDGKSWEKTSRENQRLRDASPFFTVSVAHDGAFGIDDVPPGEYRMSVGFDSAGRSSAVRWRLGCLSGRTAPDRSTPGRHSE